ncbi:glutaminase A [Planctomonas deserti]|uniref:glutaminase A n=1 Tax=Planctomonas deserti TaxID=2144185 RepID=UPI000D3C5FBB|nr:glutaminase A [Planctomonas deserti]
MTDIADAASRLDLDALRLRLLERDEGKVNESIPELANADPGVCGIALALRDGQVLSSEDTDVEYSIQSAVKPFVYALALADDADRVHDAVGIEPTGEAFDAIRLESGSGRAPNPMVNAGALLTASFVRGSSIEERAQRILDGLGLFAGQDLRIDDSVVESEQKHGDRNHALAHLMRSEGTLQIPVDDAVAGYARSCSVLVTTKQLAVMGATLAFGGVNPMTGRRAVSEDIARDVMSVMATCGVYDGSGTWFRRVGVPAKSSVSGAIVLSAPQLLGAAVHSPPLDPQGTSARGAVGAEVLSDELDLHVLSTSRS